MLESRRSRTTLLGALRLGVGVGLILAPRRATGLDDPSSALLVRTIGVRDLVLGAGAVLAARSDVGTWGVATLASDSLDVVVGTLAAPGIGRKGGLTAALLPVPFVGAGIWAMRGRPPGS
jgi:hypothetical protein